MDAHLPHLKNPEEGHRKFMEKVEELSHKYSKVLTAEDDVLNLRTMTLEVNNGFLDKKCSKPGDIYFSVVDPSVLPGSESDEDYVTEEEYSLDEDLSGNEVSMPCKASHSRRRRRKRRVELVDVLMDIFESGADNKKVSEQQQQQENKGNRSYLKTREPEGNRRPRVGPVDQAKRPTKRRRIELTPCPEQPSPFNQLAQCPDICSPAYAVVLPHSSQKELREPDVFGETLSGCRPTSPPNALLCKDRFANILDKQFEPLKNGADMNSQQPNTESRQPTGEFYQSEEEFDESVSSRRDSASQRADAGGWLSGSDSEDVDERELLSDSSSSSELPNIPERGCRLHCGTKISPVSCSVERYSADVCPSPSHGEDRLCSPQRVRPMAYQSQTVLSSQRVRKSVRSLRCVDDNVCPSQSVRGERHLTHKICDAVHSPESTCDRVYSSQPISGRVHSPQHVCDRVHSSQRVRSEIHSPPRVRSEIHSPQHVRSEIHSPQRVRSEIHSPQRVRSEIHSPQLVRSEIHSPQRLRSEIHSPQRVGNGVHSSQHVRRRIHSPRRVGNRMDSPQHVGNGVRSPQRVRSEIHSPQRVGNGVHSPRRVGNGPHSPQRVRSEIHSPQRVGNGVHSPRRVGNGVHSPQQVRRGIHSPRCVRNGVHSPQRVRSEIHSSQRVRSEIHSPHHVRSGIHSSQRVRNGIRSPQHISNGIHSPQTVLGRLCTSEEEIVQHMSSLDAEQPFIVPVSSSKSTKNSHHLQNNGSRERASSRQRSWLLSDPLLCQTPFSSRACSQTFIDQLTSGDDSVSPLDNDWLVGEVTRSLSEDDISHCRELRRRDRLSRQSYRHHTAEYFRTVSALDRSMASSASEESYMEDAAGLGIPSYRPHARHDDDDDDDDDDTHRVLHYESFNHMDEGASTPPGTPITTRRQSRKDGMHANNSDSMFRIPDIPKLHRTRSQLGWRSLSSDILRRSLSHSPSSVVTRRLQSLTVNSSSHRSRPTLRHTGD